MGAAKGRPSQALSGESFQGPTHTSPGLCLVRGNWEVTAARALNTIHLLPQGARVLSPPPTPEHGGGGEGGVIATARKASTGECGWDVWSLLSSVFQSDYLMYPTCPRIDALVSVCIFLREN